MDQVEQEFLATQINQPLIWLRYIDDIFFIWTHGEEELEKFMSNFHSFTPNLKFTYESSKRDILFLDHRVSLTKCKLSTDLPMKPTDCHQYLHYPCCHPEYTKRSIVYSHLLRVTGFILVKVILIGINLTGRYGFRNEDTRKALLRMK